MLIAKPASYKSLYLLLLLLWPAALPVASAQERTYSPLYKTLKTQDSLLFNIGFNHCDITQLEKLVSDTFEFYHDQAGITASKAAFIDGVKNGLCKLDYKPRRELVEGSLEVYPLMKGGVVYGAIQTGSHRFYAIEKNKPEHFTSRAKFTHVWQLENGTWKLLRGLSYDHQEKDSPDVPDFNDASAVNAWISKNKVPALGIGLIRDGQLQEVKMYGELDKGRPASYNSIFNVASITKPITAMTALKLASAGKWDLDEPLYHYWTDPDVQADPNSKKITTRNILNQQSGFPNWRWELKPGKLAFLSEPGTRYGYSGEGFEYLRHALEAKFGKPLDQLADELIFKQLGMDDSHYTWDKSIDSLRFAIPHDALGNALPIDKNTQPNGADLVKTTIPDLARFLIATMNGDGLLATIADEMVKRAVKTKDNRYIGLSWFIYDNLGDGEYALCHGGADKGAQTICFILPKSRQGILIFTNSDNGPKLYTDIIKNYLKEKGQAIVDIEMK